MKYHKEGNKIILTSSLIIIVLIGLVLKYMHGFPVMKIFISILLVILLVIIIQFFRVPERDVVLNDNLILSPADGKIVVIEEVVEDEYFNNKRIQVSVFMSPLNVHVNYYPISGLLTYVKYHAGKYLVAWHPKSSKENEHTTMVLKNKNGVEILFRQIAGAMARRIVCYANESDNVKQAQQVGFIKFGSRIDLLLPTNVEILVDLNQKVKGQITPIARLPENSDLSLN